MFNHRFNENASFKTYADWFVLSFLAGNINTGGFLSCGYFVSHITGFATLTGVSLERANFLEALGILTIPGYFLLGVMVSAYLTEKKHAIKAHGQKYAPVMGAVAICLLLVALGGSMQYFGEFGARINLGHDYFLLALLCGACGLQNAAITSASGSTVRTTHLTGITTDLGIGLIRAEVHYDDEKLRAHERKSNLLRIGTIASFVLGSIVGALVYSQLGYLGFVLPAVLAVYASFAARRG